MLVNSRNDIDHARNTVSRLASKDMSFANQSKARVDEMMGQLEDMNQRIEQQLAQVSELTGRVSQAVGETVRSLLFEDVVTQLAEYSDHHLDRLGEMVKGVHDGLESLSTLCKEDLEQCRRILGEIRRQLIDLSNGEQAHKPVVQADMSEGDIELF